MNTWTIKLIAVATLLSLISACALLPETEIPVDIRNPNTGNLAPGKEILPSGANPGVSPGLDLPGNLPANILVQGLLASAGLEGYNPIEPVCSTPAPGAGETRPGGEESVGQAEMGPASPLQPVGSESSTANLTTEELDARMGGVNLAPDRPVVVEGGTPGAGPDPGSQTYPEGETGQEGGATGAGTVDPGWVAYIQELLAKYNPSNPSSVPFTSILNSKSLTLGIDQPFLVLTGNPAYLDAIHKAIGVTTEDQKLRSLDLCQVWALAVFRGQAPNPGHGIMIQNIEFTPQEVRVVVEFTTGSADLVVPEVIVYPYEIAVIPVEIAQALSILPWNLYNNQGQLLSGYQP